MVPPPPARRRASPAVTLGLLAVACVSYVLQQTLVVPALPTIQRDLDTTTTWVTWVFTGFLLASAVATPLLGKLGDTYGKKRLLVIVMLIFLVGTIGAALANSIAALIAARALQGAAGALFPLAFGIVRDELPPERVGMGLGLLSATFGVGGGVGLVLSGVILESLPWTWLFWIGAVPVAVALVLVWRLVPESPVRTPSRLDWRGALTLSAGLSALLLALTEGERWGWISAATLGVAGASVVLLCLWVWVELRVPEPMVNIAMMRDRAVLWTNVVAVIAGFAMFGTFLLVPSFVQAGAGVPDAIAARIDYGFDASVIVAGLFLLPASAVMLVVGPLGGLLETRVGARALAGVGSAVLGAGGLTLAFAHSTGAGDRRRDDPDRDRRRPGLRHARQADRGRGLAPGDGGRHGGEHGHAHDRRGHRRAGRRGDPLLRHHPRDRRGPRGERLHADVPHRRGRRAGGRRRRAADPGPAARRRGRRSVSRGGGSAPAPAAGTTTTGST